MTNTTILTNQSTLVYFVQMSTNSTKYFDEKKSSFEIFFFTHYFLDDTWQFIKFVD